MRACAPKKRAILSAATRRPVRSLLRSVLRFALWWLVVAVTMAVVQ